MSSEEVVAERRGGQREQRRGRRAVVFTVGAVVLGAVGFAGVLLESSKEGGGGLKRAVIAVENRDDVAHGLLVPDAQGRPRRVLVEPGGREAFDGYFYAELPVRVWVERGTDLDEVLLDEYFVPEFVEELGLKVDAMGRWRAE